MIKAISKENIVKEIHSLLLNINVVEQIYKNTVPGIRVRYERDDINYKYECEYKCPICGKTGLTTSKCSNFNVMCSCGMKIEISNNYHSYNGINKINLNNYLNNEITSDENKENIKLICAVNNNEIKGAVGFSVELTPLYQNEKLSFKLKLLENIPIILFGVDKLKKFNWEKSVSLNEYCYNSLWIGDFTAIYGINIFNYNGMHNYYTELAKQKKQNKTVLCFDDDNIKYSSLNLKKYIKTVDIPVFVKTAIKTNINANTTLYDIYCPHCKKHFELQDYFVSDLKGNCPHCGTEYTEIQNKSTYCGSYYNCNKIEISVIGNEAIIAVREYCKNLNSCQPDMMNVVFDNVSHFFTIGLDGDNKGVIIKYNLENGKIINKKRTQPMGKNIHYRYYEVLSDDERLNHTAIKKFCKYIEENGNCLNIYNVVQFLMLSINYSIVEKIVNAGLSSVIRNIIVNNNENSPNYNFNAGALHDFFKVPKYIYKIGNKYLNTNISIMNNLLEINNITGVNTITPKDMEYILEYNIEYIMHVMVSIAKLIGATLSEQLIYIERVRVNQCIPPKDALFFWKDYLSSAQQIGINIKDKSAKYPSSLRREHDIVCYKATLINNKEQQDKFKQYIHEIAKKYEWNVQSEDYIITYPKSIEELFEEGRVLNHCVGVYADSIIKGRDAILFLRNKKTADIPYYTINVNPKTNEVVEIASFSNKKLDAKSEHALYEFLMRWTKRKNISGLKRCI